MIINRAPKTANTVSHSQLTWLKARQIKASIGARKTPSALPNARRVANTGGGATTKPTHTTCHMSTNANARIEGEWEKLMGVRQGLALRAH